MSVEIAKTSISSSLNETEDASKPVPSGFVLKLFQMVNGSDDEVIKWTPDGDAFIIGSDVERLEADYLPKYFRTARFQSFVRQLSFYSFRKMNRERNTWVYKHDLFQREKPELLHLVRRRTCPGNDKRKQRSLRVPKERADEKSDEDSFVSGSELQQPCDLPEKLVPVPSKKRAMVLSDYDKIATSKRLSPQPSPTVVVDTTVFRGWPAITAVSEESDDQVSTSKLKEAEQMAIVSDVALQLAKYARRAQKTSRSRSRRAGSGMVTPPEFKLSSGNLLTYDDEADDFEYNKASKPAVLPRRSVSNESRTKSALQNQKVVSKCIPSEIAESLVKCVVDSASDHPEQETLVSAANVASFCMSATASIESGKDYLCRKILEFVMSSENVALEFLLYRSALQPLKNDGIIGPAELNQGGLFMSNTRERAPDAVREFAVFAINRIFAVLEYGCKSGILCKDAVTLLERTAEIWQKSVWSTD